MQMKARRLVAPILLCTMLLSACYPGPEKIGELAKTSMQQRFRDDPQFQGAGIEVVGVRVVGGGDKKFDAVASLLHAGKKHEVPVTIVVDGINLQWFADPAAFGFAARPPPPDAQQIPR